jgi:hypothetical protein
MSPSAVVWRGETDLSHSNDITKCIIMSNVDRVVTVCVFSTSVESSMSCMS